MGSQLAFSLHYGWGGETRIDPLALVSCFLSQKCPFSLLKIENFTKSHQVSPRPSSLTLFSAELRRLVTPQGPPSSSSYFPGTLQPCVSSTCARASFCSFGATSLPLSRPPIRDPALFDLFCGQQHPSRHRPYSTLSILRNVVLPCVSGFAGMHLHSF